MIKSVSGNGKYMLINMGHPSPTYMNNSSGYMNVGDMRYNPQMQRIEVTDVHCSHREEEKTLHRGS